MDDAKDDKDNSGPNRTNLSSLSSAGLSSLDCVDVIGNAQPLVQYTTVHTHVAWQHRLAKLVGEDDAADGC